MLRLFVALTVAMLGVGPAKAAWRVAESAHFRVFSESSADALRKRVELLEDYRNLLGMFTTAQVADTAPKLDIYLVDDLADAVPFSKVSSTVAGFYTASDQGIGAFAIKGENGQRVLQHEYAHHHMFASASTAYPAWYVEGFAEYFMTASFQPKRVDFGVVDAGRAYSLRDLWLPWDKVIGRNPDGMKGSGVFRFYAQSWLLTHYMFRAPGMADKHRAHLRAIAGGADPLDAFKTHVFPDLTALEKTLRSYIRGSSFTYSQMKREPPAVSAVTVRDLPASADAMLMYYAWFDTRGPAVRDGKAALAKVQAAAARYPGDDLAIRTLAMAEIYFGDAKKAAALLAGPLAKAPDNPELLRLQAMALLGQDRVANRSEARRLLVKAVRLAPTDWRALHVYVHTHDIEQQPADKNLADVVALMRELAPQADGIVIDMASVLVQSGQLGDAAKILEPVAFSPHSQPISQLAGKLRDAALAGDKAAYVKLLSAGLPKPDADDLPSGEKPADPKEGPPKPKPAS